MANSLLIQRRSALLAYAHFAISAHLVSDAHRTASWAHQLHIGNRNPALLLGDAALNVALRVRAHVLFHHHHVLDQKLGIVGKHAQHASFLTLIPPRDDFHAIVAPDIHSLMFCADN